jgi:hypothetical protein
METEAAAAAPAKEKRTRTLKTDVPFATAAGGGDSRKRLDDLFEKEAHMQTSDRLQVGGLGCEDGVWVVGHTSLACVAGCCMLWHSCWSKCQAAGGSMAMLVMMCVVDGCCVMMCCL